MKKFLSFLPALLLMMVVTATFAFRSAPTAAPKATDTFVFVYNGDWELVESGIVPECPNTGAICAIRVADLEEAEQAQIEALSTSLDLSHDGTLPSGGEYFVKGN